MIERMRQMKRDEGFTLIELLIVIVILGILAAVVVVAVSGINDRGQASACTTDLQSVRTAQEAYWSKNGVYGNETALKTGGFLGTTSTLHNVTVGATIAAATSATNAEGVSATGAAYVAKYQNAACGTVGQVAP